MVGLCMKRIRRRFVPQLLKLRVARSRTGRGIFAEQDIPRGTCILEYIGRPLTHAQQLANKGKYYFWTGRNSMIDGNIPANTARFINHSCVPNCEVDLKNRRIYIFAKRNIRKDEELNYDYGDGYFDMHLKPKGCLCSKCTRGL